MDTQSSHLGSKRKRNRPALSCGHCRFRKLKCNRATPCQSCIKTGDAATCSYGSRERPGEGQSSIQFMDRDALTSRIDRLEGLLVAVMNNPTQQPSPMSSNGVPETSNVFKGDFSNSRSHITQIGEETGGDTIDMEQLGKEFGVLRVDDSQTVYHGGQHWVSTIMQIQEFRDYLEANSDDLGRVAIENRDANKGQEKVISLVQGIDDPLSKKELVSYVPPRVVTDFLIARFFSHVSHSIPLVHESIFRQEYIEHWNTSSRTSLTWLALLFSIMHHAELAIDADCERHAQSCASEYRQRSIQCLIAANYMAPQVYTIETLILHIYAEWTNSPDSCIEVSILLGMTIRLAMRAGMHRDSKAHNDVTPFQGEMRRRVWAILRSMDIVCSFQLSLPAAIHDSDSHCTLPGNIFDGELDKNMTVLPPPRPLSEETEISYTIIKARLILELGKIVVFSESGNFPIIDDISKYEQSLEEVKRMIPQCLSISSAQEPTTVSAQLQLQRIELDRLYQVSQCVLHRAYLKQARSNPSNLQHRGMCIDAAMTLLAHQATLYLNLSYPQNICNRHMHSLTTHDFFTASMAVALDLHYGFEAEPFTPNTCDMNLWGYDRRNEMIAALETSTEFCKMSKDESVEAANAHGMLTFVIAKARKAQWMIAEQQVRGNSNTAKQLPNMDTTAPFSELSTEIFPDALPDFDWNLWAQFNSNYGDIEPPTQWQG